MRRCFGSEGQLVTATANLVDITESGSSRKMSGIHSQAANLAARYKALADAEAAVTKPTNTATTGRIVR